jgi:5-oxoprolinase (ATP-hydrolysing) subunit A
MAGVDFNSDLGESLGLWERGADDAMMQVISSANVACGFHAGDPGVMRETLAKAERHRVAVGAHPGLPDLLGFGRRRMDVSPRDVRDYVLYQIGALSAFAHALGLRLHHVKPHGALYVMALDDPVVAAAVAEAVAEFDPGLPVYTLAGGALAAAAERVGLRVVPEFFADRPLASDGSVVMFNWRDRIDASPEAIAQRVRSFLTAGSVPADDGTLVAVTAESICVHSDTPNAAEIGPAVRAAIEGSGREVTAELHPAAGAGERR